jgi:hypothetical protein
MKNETIEEFIARGGKVNVVPAQERVVPAHTITPLGGGPAHLMTLGEGNLYYGEIKPRKMKKAKPISPIDINALPKALRDKYFKELLDDNEG